MLLEEFKEKISILENRLDNVINREIRKFEEETGVPVDSIEINDGIEILKYEEDGRVWGRRKRSVSIRPDYKGTVHNKFLLAPEKDC